MYVCIYICIYIIYCIGWGNEPSGWVPGFALGGLWRKEKVFALLVQMYLLYWYKSACFTGTKVQTLTLRKEKGAGQGVEIERCRVLEASGCIAVCANVCKGPTQVCSHKPPTHACRMQAEASYAGRGLEDIAEVSRQRRPTHACLRQCLQATNSGRSICIGANYIASRYTCIGAY
jgi:hypothetical protein